MAHTKGPWRFEESTKTIRSDPTNYWLASMDSWDGAVDHNANAALIAAAPDMLAALKSAESDQMAYVDRLYKDGPRMAGSLHEAQERLSATRKAIAKAEGRS